MSIGASVGAAGLAGSAAGAPLAQSRGAENARAAEAGAQERRIAQDVKASDAAGIGQTDGEDHESSERDADGRRMWEAPIEKATPPAAAAEAEPAEPKRAPDATGQSGTQLDLLG